MHSISIIGTGYVGLITGVCLASLGHDVTCIDTDIQKLNQLRKGIAPTSDLIIEDLLRRNLGAGRLHFTDDYATGTKQADLVFITVDTNLGTSWATDLRWIPTAARQIGRSVVAGSTLALNQDIVPIDLDEVMITLLQQHAQSDIPTILALATFCIAAPRTSWYKRVAQTPLTVDELDARTFCKDEYTRVLVN